MSTRDDRATVKADLAAAKARAKAARPFYRKKRFIVLVAAVLLAGGCALASGGDKTTATAASTPAAAAAASTGSDNSAAFGTPIDRDGLVLTVTRPKPGSSAVRPTVCTTVTYENHTDQPVNFNAALDWKLTDTTGVQVNTGFLGADPAKALSAGTVIPGGRKTGTVCFDKGAGDPQEVAYTGSLFGSPSTWR